jgi:hypothetical protein
VRSGGSCVGALRNPVGEHRRMEIRILQRGGFRA